jgi:hypothetical protein
MRKEPSRPNLEFWRGYIQTIADTINKRKAQVIDWERIFV